MVSSSCRSRPPSTDIERYRAGLEIFSWDYSRAVTHLERALEIDPQFWLPRVVLLFAYLNTGQAVKGREQLAEMEHDRGRRKPAERLFIDFLRESTAGRSVEALRLLRDLESLMPRSLLVNHNVVEQLLEDNRPNAAVEAYKRLNVDVRTLRHSIGTWRMNVATRALHMVGEYERELRKAVLDGNMRPACCSLSRPRHAHLRRWGGSTS